MRLPLFQLLGRVDMLALVGPVCVEGILSPVGGAVKRVIVGVVAAGEKEREREKKGGGAG